MLEKHLNDTVEINKIIEFFPTVSVVDKEISNPFYERCFTMNQKVLGYTGYKDDINDFGYKYFIPQDQGVSLWVLVFDETKNTWVFAFVKTRHFSEIGTKHGMLLHKIAETLPNARLVMAGEVDMQIEDEKRTMKWNNSSGTLTINSLFGKMDLIAKIILSSFAGEQFKDTRIKFLLSDVATRLKTKLTPADSARYILNIGGSVVANVIFRLLSTSVFPKSMPDVEHRFIYSQVASALIDKQPNFIAGNPSLSEPMEQYAPRLCDMPEVKQHLYLYDDKETCNTDIKSGRDLSDNLYCGRKKRAE